MIWYGWFNIPNKSNIAWQYYSLYFEPMTQVDRRINFIEVEKGTRNDFNYYGIDLKMEEGIELMQ